MTMAGIKLFILNKKRGVGKTPRMIAFWSKNSNENELSS